MRLGGGNSKTGRKMYRIQKRKFLISPEQADIITAISS
jgi:hypothetical protein